MSVQNPTVNFGWALPTPGASVGVWGQMLNQILGDDATGIDAVLKQIKDIAEAALPKAGGSISGNLSVTGNVTVGGTASVTGDVTLSGDLDVVGAIIQNGVTVLTTNRTLQNVTAGASIISSGTFNVDRIPSLPASKITSGTFDDARIPNLSASKITSGTFSVSRGGTGRSSLTSGALLLGAGTGAVNFLAPGGNFGFAFSNGSTWVRRQITVSTSAPSGTPADGDIWFRY